MQVALKSHYKAFAVEAEAFCRLLETMDATQRESLLRVRVALTSLYAAGMKLPQIEGKLPRSGQMEKAAFTGQQRELFRRWRREFPVDEFRVVFNPLAKTDEPVTGSLADCLADTWGDLRPGLEALQEDDGANPFLRREVWWQWKFGFDYHWGRHALEALYALHWLASHEDS